ARLHHRDPARPRGGGDGRRLDPARRIRADPAPARRTRARRDVHLRVHHELERVHLRERPAPGPAAPDADRVALRLLRNRAAHGLGRVDGRLDAHGDPGRRLLPARPAEDRVRAHGRRRQGLMGELERLALACVFPGFPGLEPPEWVRRRLADGLGGVVLFAWNVDAPEQVASLTRAIRAERRETLVAIDEEGGDVTRLEAGSGSSYPGNLALGTVDDVAL